jgi:hypothetical protein
MSVAPEYKPLSPAQMQSVLLRLLSGQGARHFLATMGNPQALAAQAAEEFPQADPMSSHQVMEGLWALVGQELAYLNFYESNPTLWTFQLTAAGPSGGAQ